MYLAKPVVYLAICRVLEFFSLFKIRVVYLAIFVVYLAKEQNPFLIQVKFGQLFSEFLDIGYK